MTLLRATSWPSRVTIAGGLGAAALLAFAAACTAGATNVVANGPGSPVDDAGPETATSPDPASAQGSDGGPDGSKAGDPLASDPHNCGATGHDCLGGACALGQCQALEIKAGPVFDDGPFAAPDDVFMTAHPEGSFTGGLVHVPRIGKPVLVPSAVETADPYLLGTDSAIAAGGLLYGNYRYSSSGQSLNGILSVDTTTGMVVKLADSPVGTQHWNAPLAVDASYVFWADQSGLHRRLRTGTTNESFAAGAVTGQIQRMASDADYLYVAVESDVSRLRKSDNQVTPLMSAGRVADMALDDDTVYIVTAGGISCSDPAYPAQIWSIAKNATTDNSMQLGHDALISGIAAAGKGRLYWFDRCAGALHLATTAPVSDRVVWTGQQDANVVVAHAGGAVYWRVNTVLWKLAD